MQPLKIIGLFLLTTGLGAHVTAQTPCRVIQPLRLQSNVRTNLPGKLIAEQQLSLRARITGYLAELPVDHGSVVARDDLLARIDAPELDSDIAQAKAKVVEADAAINDAKATLALAQSKVAEAEGGIMVASAELKLAEVRAQRTRQLVEKRGATPQQLDEVEGQLAMAQARRVMALAALATAQSRVTAARSLIDSAEARKRSSAAALARAETVISFAKLTCPFDTARVTMRRIDPGELVIKDQTVLLDLARVDKLRAEFFVTERDAVKITAGTSVDLRIDADSDQTMQVKVSRTTGTLTKSNVMIVQVDIDNSKGSLKPGMFVYASILLESEEGALTLPATALHTESHGKHYVLIAADGIAKKVPVVIRNDNGIRVQIESGLTGDESVIVAGLVEAGGAVRIEETSK